MRYVFVCINLMQYLFFFSFSLFEGFLSIPIVHQIFWLIFPMVEVHVLVWRDKPFCFSSSFLILFALYSCLDFGTFFFLVRFTFSFSSWCSRIFSSSDVWISSAAELFSCITLLSSSSPISSIREFGYCPVWSSITE